MDRKRNIFLIACLLITTVVLVNSFAMDTSYGAQVAQKDVVQSSKNVEKFVNENQKLPNTVKVASKTYTTEEFTYLMSKTIVNKNKNSNAAVSDKTNIKKPTKPSGTATKGDLTSKEMATYSQNVVNFMDKNNRAPNFVTTKAGTVQYDNMVFTMAKYLAKTDGNGKLPSKATITPIPKKGTINTTPGTSNQSTNPPANSAYTTSLFSKYQGDSLAKYLAATKNAPANSKYIKDLAAQITKGKTSQLAKAEAIFDWVKNNIKYSRYGGTKFGGESTIKNRKGNCVDNSHALVSLLRASGVHARYGNGVCQFTKGDLAGVTVAHVYVQVLIGNQWMVADGIYNQNKLGVINNWRPSTYKHYGYYATI